MPVSPLTTELFAAKFREARHFVNLNKKPVWLIPGKTDYFLSIIAPKPDELPKDTSALQYGPNTEDPDDPLIIQIVRQNPNA